MRIEKVIGHKSGLSCKKYAECMREICSDPERIFEINGELWLEIADMLENKQNDMDAESERLKKELKVLAEDFHVVTDREGRLQRKVDELNQICEEGRATTEFQKGKIEAYEFALRCIGGKDGN